MGRLGLMPLALIALPVWQALATVPVAARAPIRLMLVLQWNTRLTQPLAWGVTWRQALALASQAPKGRAHWFAQDA